jgi:hypothetical protein
MGPTTIKTDRVTLFTDITILNVELGGRDDAGMLQRRRVPQVCNLTVAVDAGNELLSRRSVDSGEDPAQMRRHSHQQKRDRLDG